MIVTLVLKVSVVVQLLMMLCMLRNVAYFFNYIINFLLKFRETKHLLPALLHLLMNSFEVIHYRKTVNSRRPGTDGNKH
jgi:hypothetical protein